MATEFISVKSTLLDVLPKLDQFTARQAPFIIAKALTATAKQVQAGATEDIKRSFKNPTPWTVNSIFIVAATKQNLTAQIAIKNQIVAGLAPIQPLNAEVYGGTRRDKRSEVALRRAGILPSGMYIVPGKGVPLNGNGNVSGALMRQIIKQVSAIGPSASRMTRKKTAAAGITSTYFVVTPANPHGRLKPGIYARFGFASGSSVRPILMFVRAPHYRERFKFFEVGQKVINEVMEKNLVEAYNLAISTTR